MSRALFPQIHKWLFLLIPITFLGFYPTYFSRLLDDNPAIFHIHALFMILWIALAIVQPILIKYKKYRHHRLIGKISFVIMPLVFITAYLIIRHIYHITLNEDQNMVDAGETGLPSIEIRDKAAARIIIGSIYLLWLVIFYLLAMIYRRRLLYHATFIFAAILTLIGPTVDRMINYIVMQTGWPYGWFADSLVFIVTMAILAILIIYQRRRNLSLKPAGISMVIYGLGILAYYQLPNSSIWRIVVENVIIP